MTESFSFKAEIQQLLDILVHSLYTDREIFLRELVSNASDALNRMQFEQLQNQDVLDADAELEIVITPDADAGTLTISDTGIGMTRDELINNIGTIARSGAKAFMEALKEKQNDSHIQDVIGQFGVGFYSVFMVADSVRVVSRSHHPDGQAWAWESDGGNEYTIEEADKATRGTDIIVRLKPEAVADFANEHKVREIIKRHSDYVAFPIYVETPAAEAEDVVTDEDDTEQAERTPVNSQQAIWRRPKRELEDDDYNQFYMMMTMDFSPPSKRIHMKADTPLQFYALLYLPGTAERSPFSPRKEPGLKLYARKVLIQDYNKDLLPEYLLQMVQGVVDSEDIPLNVSRESVKADAIIAKLRSTLTNKVLSELERMARKRPDEYLDIFAVHGRWLKQGVAVEPSDRESLMPLLFFATTRSEDQNEMFSLGDYVNNMVEGQEEIYYIVGDDYTSTTNSPHLDAFQQRGIEVLLLTDPVDPIMVMGLDEYEGHSFRSVDDANIDLSGVGTEPETDEEEETREPVPEADFEDVVERFKAVLGDRVTGVQVGKNLVSSPARLVTAEGAASANHMFRVNRLFEREYDLPVKTLELNPRHVLLHNLTGMLHDESQQDLVDNVVEQVFETALLQEGIHPDPASMARRLYDLLEAATGTKNGAE